MKIILLQDVRGLGKKHEIKEVAGGYGRNFLIAKGLAKAATQETEKSVEAMKAKAEKEQSDLLKRLRELARLIDEHHIEFRLRTDEKGTVYGSVTKEMILKAMREHEWLRKERVEIELAHPLKEIGDYAVAVDLKKGIRATLKVAVRPQP